MNDFYASLFPILVVDRWADINDEFLYQKYKELKAKKYRYDLLDADAWFDYLNIKKGTNHMVFEEIVGKLMTGSSPDYSKNVLYV